LMDAPQTEREKSQNITRRPRVRDLLAQSELYQGALGKQDSPNPLQFI
jgi:hypothetical protein